MLEIVWSKAIKKDLKRFLFQKDVIKALNEVIHSLAVQDSLPPKYRDHYLIGDWVDFRECHIKVMFYSYTK